MIKRETFVCRAMQISLMSLALWGSGSADLIAYSPIDDTDSNSAKDAENAIDTSGMVRHEGFFDFFWDESKGKIWLQVERFDEPFLYVSSLASGLGSNPVGLDRGQLGDNRVVRFRRVGPKVYLEQENLKYRARVERPAERRAVRDSFASSILWAGDHRKTADDALVVDITSFLLRDAHDCIGTLSSSGQGSFTLNADRSFVFLERTKSFPKNSEFEVALTFSSTSPGALVQRTSASGNAVTLRQHHSFVKLPDNRYRPRRFDPRCGCFKITFSDYAAPLAEPLEKHFITRHRLQKRDRDEEKSQPIEPIVYYIDPGVPEPVRQALIDGAKWWNEAFEEAGYIDAFQVRVLPAEADPMDVRYNVVQWVHRATRGWSYGQSVIDPRTGEIIKGHVLLGSLRVRQDQLLADTLTGPGNNRTGRNGGCGMAAVPNESHLAAIAGGEASVRMALARIRQLSAHEVGHTLGFAHNFAASTYADRASVMDYPAPRANIVDGKIDLSDAYGTEIGAWDKFTVKYAYMDLPADVEKHRLEELIEETISKGMRYVSDADARLPGAANPYSNLWDNGSDPIEALRHEMQVRRIAIDQFDASLIPEGQPLAQLEMLFVPTFLHHRYQVEATAKMIGGYDYAYAVHGDHQTPLTRIPSGQQKAALAALLETIRPGQLVVPERVANLIPPKPFSSLSDRERFSSRTAPMFDAVQATRVSADMTLGHLLQPQRATRLARIDDQGWGLHTMLDLLIKETWKKQLPRQAKEREAAWVVRHVFIDRLIQLADSQHASPVVRAVSLSRLKRIQRIVDEQIEDEVADDLVAVQLDFISNEIQRFVDRPHPSAKPSGNVEYPPGSPIGGR